MAGTGQHQASVAMETALDPGMLGRLRWSCRRGLLENDLFIQRFFERHGAALTARQAQGLTWLMQLSDNELLDLLLRRCELPTGHAQPAAAEVLALMRSPPPEHSREGNAP